MKKPDNKIPHNNATALFAIHSGFRHVMLCNFSFKLFVIISHQEYPGELGVSTFPFRGKVARASLSLISQLFFITSTIKRSCVEGANIALKSENQKNNRKILESYLDSGEASSIALALEKKECLLIIDEFKGRREAKLLKLDFTGTIGVFIIAKEKGYIISVSEIITEIQKNQF